MWLSPTLISDFHEELSLQALSSPLASSVPPGMVQCLHLPR